MERREGLDIAPTGFCPWSAPSWVGSFSCAPSRRWGLDMTTVGRKFSLAPPLAPGAGPGQSGSSPQLRCQGGLEDSWENNRECWHCHVGHPEYVKSHFDTSDTTSPKVSERIARRTQAMATALGAWPWVRSTMWPGWRCSPRQVAAGPPTGPRCVEGFSTESLDGGVIAPLMGDYKSYEVGVLRPRALPEFLGPRQRRPRCHHPLGPRRRRPHRGPGHLARRRGRRRGP